MASIDVSALTFVDVNQDKYGSFVQSENLDAFVDSPLGQAQVECMREEMAAQMEMQGVEDYEATDRQLRRALFSEQASQEYGISSPDVTDEQMLDDHGPSMVESLVNWFTRADEATGDVVRSGVDATVEHVTHEGMTGAASESLSLREMQINKAVDDAVNGGGGMTP